MKITSSYDIEIKNINKMLLPTAKLYQEAVSFCIDVFENEWSDIEPLATLSRNNFAEHVFSNQDIRNPYAKAWGSVILRLAIVVTNS